MRLPYYLPDDAEYLSREHPDRWCASIYEEIAIRVDLATELGDGIADVADHPGCRRDALVSS